jgi:hypothetical protein
VPEIFPIMPNKRKRVIPALELKRILIEIHEHRVEVGVRFRLVGQMWHDQFVRIVGVTEDRVSMIDEPRQKVLNVDLRHVVQFEFDGKFREFEPNFHYDIALFGNQ